MRQLLQCRGIRSVCYALIIALASTIAPISPFTKPVSAQLISTYRVGVVDFINESGVQGDLLTRLATDAVVVEMGKTARYDVSVSRHDMDAEMEKMGMRPPLTKLDLIRLGESLFADAMLEGSIKSVQLAGSGATRRASVTLVAQMIDEASGEIINGAVQAGTSSARARVGYTADDDSLIAEAINGAAFLLVKTMVDYIIPEATVMMNIGESQVMLNKGSRDGLKPGMRMIVLRQKEIIGYVEVQKVTANNSDAKVVKSMRGMQPEDKVRAIFDMPAVSTSLKSEPLPSGAPSGGGGGGKGALSKIGKFLLGAAIVFGLVSMFKGGRGSEDAPTAAAGAPMVIRWDVSKYGGGKNVDEIQILRNVDDYFSAEPVMVIKDPTAINYNSASVKGLYTATLPIQVPYFALDTDPSPNKGTQRTATVLNEGFSGTTYRYEYRILYHETTIDQDGKVVPNQWRYSPRSAPPIIITAIEPVMNSKSPSDIISPFYDPKLNAPLIQLDDIYQGTEDARFEWNPKDGADIYYMTVTDSSKRVIWKSGEIEQNGQVVALTDPMRLDLASRLINYSGQIMKWRVYCRNSGDTSPGWVEGQESKFELGLNPPSF